MKKILITFFVLNSFFSNAQQDTTSLISPPFTPYETLLDSIWMNVDKSTLQTPFLTDYGPWFTNPTWYDGTTLSTDNMLNYSKIKSVYNSFAYSELDTNYILNDWDSVVNDIEVFTQNQQIPIVVMCLPYDKLDENAINNGWITTDGKYMYSTPSTPSPFVQSLFYGVSLAADILDSNFLEVILPSTLILMNLRK